MVVLKEEDDEVQSKQKLTMKQVDSNSKTASAVASTDPPTFEASASTTMSSEVGMPTRRPIRALRRQMLLASALAMVVFGAFILGIIIANSFAERETKLALCYY